MTDHPQEPADRDSISRNDLLKAFRAMQFGLGIVDRIPRMDVSAAISLIEQEPRHPLAGFEAEYMEITEKLSMARIELAATRKERDALGEILKCLGEGNG